MSEKEPQAKELTIEEEIASPEYRTWLAARQIASLGDAYYMDRYHMQAGKRIMTRKAARTMHAWVGDNPEILNESIERALMNHNLPARAETAERFEEAARELLTRLGID